MKEFDRLVEIIKVLRSPAGCPWDRAQKSDDYAKYLLEETYELIDGLHEKDLNIIEEELGDLFLILVSISEIFRKNGKFNVQDVLMKVNKKLVTRHPHVFSSKKLKGRDDVLRYWIKEKAKKKKRKTINDRLPKSAPALLLAEILLKEHENSSRRSSLKSKKRTLLSGIIKDIDSFCASKSKKGREKILVEAVFEICKIAAVHKIDLENLLRAKVIKTAGKIAY